MNLPPHIEKQIEEEAIKASTIIWEHEPFEPGPSDFQELPDEDKYSDLVQFAHTMAPALIEYGMALGIQKVIDYLNGKAADFAVYQDPERQLISRHWKIRAEACEKQFAPELCSLNLTGEENGNNHS